MSNNLKTTPPHWIDKLTTDLISNWPGIKTFNSNCGISVSGQQHIGRLRGEIVLTNAVVNELKIRGYEATHSLILYTADPWKGKKAQLDCFSDPDEAKKYIDWRLIDVPDPTNQYPSWVDYFWRAFGDYLPKFARNVEIIRTHEFYQTGAMKNTIIKLIEKKEQVRKILNKYRKENPFPEDWIPFKPLCNHCNRIGTTKALEVDLDEYRVHYYCDSCQKDDWSDMKLGKLTWRLEWLAIWYTLNIHFEPYGKDHATPGGSRDSCIEVLETVLQHPGPYGFWNEWVGYSEGRTDFGDMTSSGFIGFTPKKWLKYSEPEVLKYIYLKTPPRRRIVLGLDKIRNYVTEYDKAQRIYFELEPFDDNTELQTIRRSYEIVFYNEPPEYRGFQLDYSHAIILSQLISASQEGTKQAIQKLQATEILTTTLTKEIEEHIHSRLTQARNWVLDYAASHLHINIPEHVSKTLIDQIDKKMKNHVQDLALELASIKWTEEEIKQKMISFRQKRDLSRKEMSRLFQVLYQIFLGSAHGPRFAPFIAALDKEWVIARLKEIHTP
ncbi:MAG: lysine--tRNA ligase [Candidatus Heimdallarchaeota archaeon]|nr:MAG: lysine--tRNA ligase [Candidatus Heimdallarchaeota archaeon]